MTYTPPLFRHPYISCSDCRVWDPENQPSVVAKLEANPHHYDNEIIVMVPNGEVMFGCPLHTQLLLCNKHKQEYI